VALDEIGNACRHVQQLQIAAPAQFLSDVGRHVVRPSFQRIETKDADRVGIFAREQILDDRFQTGVIDVSFALDAAEPPKIVHHKVDVLIVAIRHDRGCPIGLIHTNSAPRPPGIKAGAADSFRSGEGVRAGLGELHVSPRSMYLQPSAIDRRLQPGHVFIWAAAGL
jgi:hypothetical protein